MLDSVTPERFKGAVGAGILVPAILYLLIAGLVVQLPGAPPRKDLLSFLTPPSPPPPPVVTVETRPNPKPRREGEAAPPNLQSQATEVTAPPVPPPPVPPPPLPAALKPFEGSQSTQGAASVAGPGTGAGGVGSGTGSGGAGDGDGGGGDGSDYTAPRQIGGRLRKSDIPDEVRDAGVRGVVSVRYFVTSEGKARDCRITRSSGSRVLDVTTCRLIEERFRFRPSLGPDGRAVGSYIVQDHYWFTNEPRPGDDDR